MRTCAVTRRTAPRDHLLRLVVSPDGEVVVDARGTLPGRGAWLLPDAETLAALPKRAGGLKRSLGLIPDGEALAVAVREAVVRAVLDGLSIARAAGVLVPGQERVANGLLIGRLDMVVLANDLSERTVEAMSGKAAAEEALVVRIPISSAALGGRVGRGPTGVLGLGPSRPARHVRRWLRRLHALG